MNTFLPFWGFLGAFLAKNQQLFVHTGTQKHLPFWPILPLKIPLNEDFCHFGGFLRAFLAKNQQLFVRGAPQKRKNKVLIQNYPGRKSVFLSISTRTPFSKLGFLAKIWPLFGAFLKVYNRRLLLGSGPKQQLFGRRAPQTKNTSPFILGDPFAP